MKKLRILCILLVCFAWMGAALADADQLVEERQANFKVLGKNAKKLRSLVKRADSNWDAIASSVADMRQASAKILDFFPPQSANTSFDTEASPEIWDNMADFTKRQQRLDTSLERLDLAVQARDAGAIRSGFAQVGSSCKGCHDKYREKD